MNPNGFGGGRVDRLPHVDAEAVGEHREFVHQSDVHVPEGVLNDLGQFGLSWRGDRHGVFDDAAVEGLHRRERIGVDTRDDLRGTDQGPGGVPRVDPLRAVAEVEVGTRDQSRPVLQPRQHLLLSRPWIRG